MYNVSRITWLNTVQRDLRAYSLTLNEAVDLAQNHSLWRLMCCLRMVIVRKEEDVHVSCMGQSGPCSGHTTLFFFMNHLSSDNDNNAGIR